MLVIFVLIQVIGLSFTVCVRIKDITDLNVEVDIPDSNLTMNYYIDGKVGLLTPPDPPGLSWLCTVPCTALHSYDIAQCTEHCTMHCVLY